jgi:DNA-binding response OmpR family regulator
MRERDLAGETRVLVLTCKLHAGEFIEAWQLGADEYVTKPVDPFVLVGKLTDLLGVPVSQLQEEREAKLEKAVLLARLESSFGKSPSWGSSIRSRL